MEIRIGINPNCSEWNESFMSFSLEEMEMSKKMIKNTLKEIKEEKEKNKKREWDE